MIRGEARTVEGHCSCKTRMPGSIIGIILLDNMGLMGFFFFFLSTIFSKIFLAFWKLECKEI